ncbi:MAG: transposase [Actinomycetota bacterium]
MQGRGIRHPFTRALYERNGDGNIVVTDGTRRGVFTSEGRWVSGELRECDPQLCGWVAGPQIGSHRVSEQSSTQ